MTINQSILPGILTGCVGPIWRFKTELITELSLSQFEFKFKFELTLWWCDDGGGPNSFSIVASIDISSKLRSSSPDNTDSTESWANHDENNGDGVPNNEFFLLAPPELTPEPVDPIGPFNSLNPKIFLLSFKYWLNKLDVSCCARFRSATLVCDVEKLLGLAIGPGPCELVPDAPEEYSLPIKVGGGCGADRSGYTAKWSGNDDATDWFLPAAVFVCGLRLGVEPIDTGDELEFVGVCADGGNTFETIWDKSVDGSIDNSRAIDISSAKLNKNLVSRKSVNQGDKVTDTNIQTKITMLHTQTQWINVNECKNIIIIWTKQSHWTCPPVNGHESCHMAKSMFLWYKLK